MTNTAILGKLDQLLRMTTDIQAEQRRQADQIASLRADVARIDGRTTDMPTARDFGRLEGRVDEMGQRLPTMIGYASPKPAAE